MPSAMPHTLPMVLFFLSAFSGAAIGGAVDALPEDFVRLGAVAPTVLQDIRYAGAGNFTGAVVPGYEAPVCILRRSAAVALAAAAEDLAREGLGLVVYDCYRPTRAVAAFVAWSAGAGVDDPRHHPSVPRARLFAEGYIARRSSHSRGASVDVGLVDLSMGATGSRAEAKSGQGLPCTSGEAESTGGRLDMGTAFDCFDRKSWTDAPGLTQAQRRHRATLVRAMGRHGFSNYPREWWHFEFRDQGEGEPRDFPVR